MLYFLNYYDKISIYFILAKDNLFVISFTVIMSKPILKPLLSRTSSV